MNVLSRVARVALLVVLVNGLGGFPPPSPARAQSEPASKADVGELKSELEGVKKGLEDVRRQLELLRQLLQRLAQPAAQPDVIVEVGVAGGASMGNQDAPVTVIEFSDYQCPFCQRFSQTTFPALKDDYIDSGKIRYVFRDFPLDGIHPQARKAAEAAHCAGEQGKYWQMHDALFGNQQALQVADLKRHSRRLGLDADRFDACLDQGKYEAQVHKNLEDGKTAGVRGTPGFVIGKTRPDGIVQGTYVSGAQPIAAFRRVIDRLLGTAAGAPQGAPRPPAEP